MPSSLRGVVAACGLAAVVLACYSERVASADEGAVSGIVRADTGTGVLAPIVGAKIRMFTGDPALPPSTWRLVASELTATNGLFTIGRLVPRSDYFFQVEPPWDLAERLGLAPTVRKVTASVFADMLYLVTLSRG